MKTARSLLLLSAALSCVHAEPPRTCCLRQVASIPIEGTVLDLAFESFLHRDSAHSECYPYAIVDIRGHEALRRLVDAIGSLYGADPDPEAARIFSDLLDLDYLFRGNLVADEVDGTYHNTLHMGFVDQQRGQVVKEGHASWTGFKGAGSDAVRILAASFLPLDELMYDHERIPEHATLRPERDPIEAGETTTIHVRDIVDGKNRNSQPWQRILVKAEKGRILNGTPQGNGYWRFEVGDGSIQVMYRAPDACRNQTETVSVWNSCTNDFRADVNYDPEREIAAGTFAIRCEPKAFWSGTVTYVRGFNEVSRQPGPDGAIVETHEIVSEQADLEIHAWPYSHSYEGSAGATLYYRGDAGSVTGSYSASYRKITTIHSAEGTGAITDSALCQAMVRDSGYLVVNTEELVASLEIGLSFVGDEPCRGQTVYSGDRGSAILDFDWDRHLSFAGQDSLKSSIPSANPRSVTGSCSLPEWGITWTWDLSLSGR